MRLGLNAPNFGPETDAASLLGWARFAERHGFDTLVVSDHVAPTREIVDLYPPPFYDPFILLAWLAGLTSTVNLATSVVILPYRHPLLTARMSAMVHEQSGGRFRLGVGSGWARSEFEALGLDFADRGRTTDAYLETILEAWSHDNVRRDVAGLRFEPVATGPAPPGGRVPVWVGGAGRAAVRRAASWGDAWHPINPDLPWLLDAGLPALRAAAAAAQRPTPELVVRIKARLEPWQASGNRPLGVGGVEQIVGDINALAQAGAVEVILDPNPDLPRPRDFGAEQEQLLEIKQAYQPRSRGPRTRPED
jgi:probable F420-dependent oxidoreductase